MPTAVKITDRGAMTPDQKAAFNVWVNSCMFTNRTLSRAEHEANVWEKIQSGQYLWSEEGLHFCPGPTCLRCLP